MATASELMSYQGSGGLGSNADIPVTNAKPLEFVNTVLRDIAARDAQKNILKFKQQVDDRDKLYEALSTGQVKVGDLLERDMPMIKGLGDKQTEAFKNWMNKGYGDIDGAAAYKKATQEMQDAVTQAQARKVFYDKESGIIAKEGVPKYAEARKGNIDKNLQNFWGDIVPFQETNRLNMGDIEKLAQPITEQITDPKRPFEKGTRKSFSFDDAVKKSAEYSITPDGLYNLQVLSDTLLEMNPTELRDKVQTVNKELDRYNRERGLTDKDADFATPLVAVQDNNGRWGFHGDSLDKVAAKISLAGQQKYKDETWEFDKDKSARDIALREDEIQKKAIAAANYRERLQQNGANYRANLPYEKMKLSASTNPGEEFGNIIYGVNGPVKGLGKGASIINGAIVNKNGAVDASINQDVEIPASYLANSIVTEFSKYAGAKKTLPDGTVVEAVSPSRLKKNDNDRYVVRFKNGVIDGILTDDGTYADIDQFQYITTQTSQKGATKYKQPEDISGGKTGGGGKQLTEAEKFLQSIKQ